MCLDSSPCDANTRLFKWHHIAMFDRHCRRRRHTHRRSFWKKSLKSQPTLRGEDTFLPTSKVTSYPVVRRRWISKLDSKQKTFLIWSLSLCHTRVLFRPHKVSYLLFLSNTRQQQLLQQHIHLLTVYLFSAHTHFLTRCLSFSNTQWLIPSLSLSLSLSLSHEAWAMTARKGHSENGRFAVKGPQTPSCFSFPKVLPSYRISLYTNWVFIPSAATVACYPIAVVVSWDDVIYWTNENVFVNHYHLTFLPSNKFWVIQFLYLDDGKACSSWSFSAKKQNKQKKIFPKLNFESFIDYLVGAYSFGPRYR